MYRLILFPFLFLLLVLSPCLAADSANLSVNIGIILPLSGDAAPLAVGAKNGIEIALDQMPENVRKRINVYFEDDSMKSANSLAAFQKLRAVNHINGLITWSSNPSKAVAPIAEKEEVPMIAIASDGSISQNKKFVFNMWVTPERLSALVYREVLNRGYRHIARIATITEGELAKVRAFDAVRTSKVEITVDEQMPFSEKDFHSFLLRLKTKKIDAILPSLLWGQLGIFARQLREQGNKQPIFGYETLESKVDVEMSQGALVGAWFATGALPTKEFSKEYERRFPGLSMFSASNAHDSLMLMANALLNSESPRGAADFLRTVKDFNGANGHFSATGDNRFDLPATLKIITDSGFEVLTPKESLLTRI